MEEILASIRRIISEDDQPGAVAAAPVAAVPAAHAPDPFPNTPALPHHDEEEDEVLELTEHAPAPVAVAAPVPAPIQVPAPRETHGDLDVFEPAPRAAPKPEPVAAAPRYEPAPPPPPQPKPEPAYMREPEPAAPMSGGIEDAIHETLVTMVNQWLDQNLKTIVEDRVAQEIKRIGFGVGQRRV